MFNWDNFLFMFWYIWVSSNKLLPYHTLVPCAVTIQRKSKLCWFFSRAASPFISRNWVLVEAPNTTFSGQINKILLTLILVWIQNVWPYSRNIYRHFNQYPSAKNKQYRSTEGCSKLKRSVDMTSSGKNGLSVRTNAIPNRDYWLWITYQD